MQDVEAVGAIGGVVLAERDQRVLDQADLVEIRFGGLLVGLEAVKPGIQFRRAPPSVVRWGRFGS
ncbi:hypothetical protein [Streptomyces lydicus]|uniref:hypothetical protein n=1 Tax=Streptomyces lydicus TaxID=47763 RepID=UPI0037A6163E